MNPLTGTAMSKKFAPMRDVSKTLQIRWYRCPVDKKLLRELMTPDDSRGLFLALGHLGLWAASGAAAFYLFLQQLWLPFAVVLFCHGTIAAFLTAPHHELCHRTVFRTKSRNEAFLRIYALIGWSNFEI